MTSSLKAVTSVPSCRIFVCDEMKVNVAETLVALEQRGHLIEYYANASDGWRHLQLCLDRDSLPELLIIDMALLPGPDEQNFPDEEIDEGQTTGIYLIEKFLRELSDKAGEGAVAAYRTRTILYTRVTEEFYVKKARTFSRRTGVPFLRKRINDDGEFLAKVLAIVGA